MWPLDRTLGTLAEAGFTAAELMVTRDPRTQSPDVVQKLAKEAGIKVVAVHAPMLVLTRRVWGPNFLEIIERSASMAAAIGADVVIVHPPYVWELKYQSWLLGKLDRFSAEKGVSIAVENMFRLWLRGTPIRGHRWVSPSDLESFTQITLDTSHCGVDGYDILRALEKVGPHLSHVHLSDSLGDHKDNHALPGTGNLPLAPFLKELDSIGSSAAISLELDMRPFIDEPKVVIESLRKAKGFCEDNLS